IAEPIIEVESDKDSGIVLEEVEAGYKLHDKIIRPARVKVSKQKNI
ncbi:MAG: nucleotide exchange factor GrpE, partial [Patescibacteria group bacterium]|nr:nucleotide exchange factor GrpE [Patescibacteria group bacterium]